MTVLMTENIQILKIHLMLELMDSEITMDLIGEEVIILHLIFQPEHMMILFILMVYKYQHK